MGLALAKESSEELEVLKAADRLLAEEKVPAYLRDQVKDLILPDATTVDDVESQLSLQAFKLDRRLADYVVSALRLAQKEPFTHRQLVAGLSLERGVEDPAALEVLSEYLQHLPPQPRVNQLTLSHCDFGTSDPDRETCRALLSARNTWRSLEFQHCNFMGEEDGPKSDMAFLTGCLNAQTDLQHFKLVHGLPRGVPPLRDSETAEIIEILCAKKTTLRTLAVKDGGNSDTSEALGQATASALVDLLQPSENCKHKLDCKLQKLVWGMPATHSHLFGERSELRQRFLAAILQNQTLLDIRLPGAGSGWVNVAMACMQRNRNIRLVGQTFGEQRGSESYPMWGLLGAALGKLAASEGRDLASDAESVHSIASAKSAEPTSSENFGSRRVSFEPRPSYCEFNDGEPVTALRRTTQTNFDASRVVNTEAVAVVHVSASAIYLALRATFEA